MRCFCIKILVVAVTLALVVESTSVLGDGGREISVDDQSASDKGVPRRVFDFIMRPFRATVRQAKKLFGCSVNEARDYLKDRFDDIQVQSFDMFAKTYGKVYETPEELRRRMSIFVERRKMIQQSLKDFVEEKAPFVMKENRFADWDDSELQVLAMATPPKKYAEMTDEEREVMFGASGAPQNEPSVSSAPMLDNGTTSAGGSWAEGNLTVMAPDRLPAMKDWRVSDCISKPIDQEKCGACYAVATMNTLESMHCIMKGTGPRLSPQQVVDCSTPRAGYQNFGCNGGWPTRVLKYLQNVGVAAKEACYPFERKQGYCRLRQVESTQGCTVSASPTRTRLNYKVLNNEDDILYHVAKTGPVITVMKARDSFVFYSRGIYDDPKCSRGRDDVDHAIVIVGYGRENGLDYWLIKNSWGEDWGEGGYGKFRRGKRACSIGHWGWVITS